MASARLHCCGLWGWPTHIKGHPVSCLIWDASLSCLALMGYVNNTGGPVPPLVVVFAAAAFRIVVLVPPTRPTRLKY